MATAFTVSVLQALLDDGSSGHYLERCQEQAYSTPAGSTLYKAGLALNGMLRQVQRLLSMLNSLASNTRRVFT